MVWCFGVFQWTGGYMCFKALSAINVNINVYGC